jgi:hypothetical protein
MTAVTLRLNSLIGSKRAEMCDVLLGSHVIFCDASNCCQHIVITKQRQY